MFDKFDSTLNGVQQIDAAVGCYDDAWHVAVVEFVIMTIKRTEYNSRKEACLTESRWSEIDMICNDLLR